MRRRRNVNVRNPDVSVEPSDGKSNGKAPLTACDTEAHPRAVSAAFDRGSNSLDLGKIPSDDENTPIITHCGGGGRGQKAKDYLLSAGFTNVANGGGPEDDECWAVFGAK